ncbi:hypothetical protein [Cyanobium sp. Copco_Reservoir_LC18]|uniref:hypothetical protein n=1 Tax=Cyanobium sp. Copco_Reservoir_LC18 TaxID=1328305 RepID=UPI001359DA95|nr:hypothetical protein [Cyanobium sp. Copco_Reservoir_LC18]
MNYFEAASLLYGEGGGTELPSKAHSSQSAMGGKYRLRKEDGTLLAEYRVARDLIPVIGGKGERSKAKSTGTMPHVGDPQASSHSGSNRWQIILPLLFLSFVIPPLGVIVFPVFVIWIVWKGAAMLVSTTKSVPSEGVVAVLISPFALVITALVCVLIPPIAPLALLVLLLVMVIITLPRLKR